MPNLKQMLEFAKADTLAWAAFLAVPLLLFCIACLMPRGRGRLLINIERAVIVVGVVAALVVPFIINKVNPDALGYDPYVEIVKHGTIMTTAVVALAIVLLWGIFTGESYMTQAMYGMLTCVCMPFGLINLAFPEWATASTVMEALKTPVDLLHILLYGACFFIPVWLIRSGEYKLRISSIWHLVSGFTVGGCFMTFAVETGFLGMSSKSVMRVLKLFDNVESFADIKNLNYSLIGKIAALVGVFVLIIMVAGLVVSIARVILKTGDKVFVSESFGGFIIRTVGNLVANLICGIGIIVVPQMVNHTAAYPQALLYLVPVILYFVVILVTAFFADTVEIKRGIKRANKELEAEAAAAAV